MFMMANINLIILLTGFCSTVTSAAHIRSKRYRSGTGHQTDQIPTAVFGQVLGQRSCPANAGVCRQCVCSQTTVLTQFYDNCVRIGCCQAMPFGGVTQPYQCPADATSRTPLTVSTTNQAVGCCPFAQCPANYRCMYDTGNDAYLCCPVAGTGPSVCPNGQASSGTCSVGQTVCGVNSVCINGYCCPSTGPNTDPYCSVGTAQIYPYSGLNIPVACGRIVNGAAVRYPGQCDPNYRYCQQSKDGRYSQYEICCRVA